MGDLSGVTSATLFVVLLFGGVLYLKRLLRKHLLPGDREADRRQAMAELLLLQAELQRRAGADADPPGSEEEGRGRKPQAE